MKPDCLIFRPTGIKSKGQAAHLVTSMFDGPRPIDHPLSAHEAANPWSGRMRVVSWNLLRRVGAGAGDVASLIRQTRPDLLLLQEATVELEALPQLVGGHFFRDPMQRRIYGLGAWSPHAIAKPAPLSLPISVLPGRVPMRIAQIVRLGGVTFANVHLSHGQFLNRWQLLHIIRRLSGPAAIVGDFNAVGPTQLPGFRDVGPRRATHAAANLISLRLDRCLASGLSCETSEVLDRGPSDHHPIVLDLQRRGS